jgi:hypothetical protein
MITIQNDPKQFQSDYQPAEIDLMLDKLSIRLNFQRFTGILPNANAYERECKIL